MNTKTQTIDQSKLDALQLTRGTHGDPEGGLCLMEAVAYLTGEPHSDRPECVSPVLGSWGRAINDAMPDARRQELKVFIPDMVGTADDGKDEARSFMCADFAVGVIAPMALDAAGLSGHATKLRELPEIVDKKTATAAAALAYRAADAADAADADADDAYGAADNAYGAASASAYRGADAAYAAACRAADAAYRAASAASPVWDAVIAFTPKLIAARADDHGGQR